MAKVILSAEGQTLDLPDNIAGDDSLLRQALVPYYPHLATAKITRVEDGGELRVTVAKQAGPKGARRRALTGSAFVDGLVAAPEHINPAVELCADLARNGTAPDQLPLGEAVLLGAVIDATIEAGTREMERARDMFEALRKAAPVPATTTPTGF